MSNQGKAGPQKRPWYDRDKSDPGRYLAKGTPVQCKPNPLKFNTDWSVEFMEKPEVTQQAIASCSRSLGITFSPITGLRPSLLLDGSVPVLGTGNRFQTILGI